jgi:hypothetical protein
MALSFIPKPLTGPDFAAASSSNQPCRVKYLIPKIQTKEKLRQFYLGIIDPQHKGGVL